MTKFKRSVLLCVLSYPIGAICSVMTNMLRGVLLQSGSPSIASEFFSALLIAPLIPVVIIINTISVLWYFNDK